MRCPFHPGFLLHSNTKRITRAERQVNDEVLVTIPDGNQSTDALFGPKKGLSEIDWRSQMEVKIPGHFSGYAQGHV